MKFKRALLAASVAILALSPNAAFAASTTYRANLHRENGTARFDMFDASSASGSAVEVNAIPMDFASVDPTPGSNIIYTAVKLSELETYVKTGDGVISLNSGTASTAKKLLLAVQMIGADALYEYAQNSLNSDNLAGAIYNNATALRAFFENTESLDQLDASARELGMTTAPGNMTYRERMMYYYNGGAANIPGEFWYRSFRKFWNKIVLPNKDTFMSYMIWGALGYGARGNDWFNDEDGSYQNLEQRLYGRHANYPASVGSGEYSLFTALFAPMINYIQSRYRDPFALGYDAMVYTTTNTTYTNIIGAAFEVPEDDPDQPGDPDGPTDPEDGPDDPDGPEMPVTPVFPDNPNTGDAFGIVAVLCVLSIIPVAICTPKLLSRRK